MTLRQALENRKYRLLFSSRRRGEPGPKGPSNELIKAVVEMKDRNPSWGSPRIAQQIALVFGIQAGTVDGVTLCRMFNRALRGHRSMPKYLSSNHDPLYRFHQGQANLRILEVTEIKTVPYVPLSHPFVERLIGTLRRECLDRTLFWTSADLENKLLDFRTDFNDHRTHTSRKGRTPKTPVPRPVANPYCYR